MEELGEIHVWHYIPWTDIPIPLGGINVYTVMNSLVVMAVLWAVLFLAVRKVAWIPSRGQVILEAVFASFQSLIDSTMFFEPPAKRRSFLPLIVGLFVYIAVSNAILIIPLPHIEKPTSDLNDTLALGLISVGFATYCGLRAKGPAVYIKEMCGPMFHTHGSLGAVIAGKLSAFFFFPLRISEELSRLISISCRLFGNIMGGAIVILVVSTLTYYIFLPQFLYGFFLVFEAALQAFVFAMLTLIYITGALQEE
ncbi:MAG: F-type H+-transporting ATPase subunit a [Candidatus Hydrogenedentes bacterium]|nr:F-type H+-transporting ATPase subunit a [Candidatus Hydrogenedentota bacterium]